MPAEWNANDKIMPMMRPSVAYKLACSIIALRPDQAGWSDHVFEACAQALECQDKLIEHLQGMVTDQVMMRPPAPIILPWSEMRSSDEIEAQSQADAKRRQWFGDPVSAFCGGVLGFILAAMIACIIWRLSV